MERSNHSAVEIGAKLARHAKAAFDIAKGYAAANLAGAIAEAVKHYLPQIIMICVAMIILPILIFICLPAMLITYGGSPDSTAEDVLNSAYSEYTNGISTYTEDILRNFLDGLIFPSTDYDADDLVINKETEYVGSAMDLSWFVAIHSVYHENNSETMSDEEIREFSNKVLGYDIIDTITETVIEQRKDSNDNIFSYTTLYIDRTLYLQYLDPYTLMNSLNFSKDDIEWAELLFSTITGKGSSVPLPEISDANFINPLPYPWRSHVTSEFGYRIDPLTGIAGNKHTGIDIAVPYGTDIFAVQDGVVVAVVYGLTDYGYYVKIDHGNGFETMYCHNSANHVEVGDEVKQGDVIAAVGSTGKSTGNHLHFEVRANGKAVEPRSYLP